MFGKEGIVMLWVKAISVCFFAIAMAAAPAVEAHGAPSDSTIDATAPVISVSPILLSAADRGQDLQLRVSAPVSGRSLPVILFAHGFRESSDSYAPLANFWAARGFVVIQPSFLDSDTAGLAPDDPRTPMIWRFRVEDMRRVLDRFDTIEKAVPGLAGRIDKDRIAAVGHSYGGITTAMLIGTRVIGPDGSVGEDLSDPRIKVGVLLSTAGKGGSDLSAFAAANFPFMNPDFDQMRRPTLVVAGDKDQSPLTVRGPDWFTDPYTLSPGDKCLITLFGGEHMLGGISGRHVTETTDENPARVAAVQELSLAYLRSALYPKDHSWADSRKAFEAKADRAGRIECK
jgi:dienelactone hydrolase